MKKKKQIPSEQEHESDIVFENESDKQIRMGDTASLKTRLKECLAERKEYLEGWQRSRADYINAKREYESEKKELVTFAKGNLLADLLPVLDSFDQAFGNREAWERVDSNWRIGVEYIHRELVRIMSEHGLEAIDPVGESFDTTLHESAGSEDVATENLHHTVIKTLQKGYRLGGKLIRPARVIVGEFHT